MIYCISDLHGRYDRYEKVLEKIQDTDELYVLGDCIDRGKDGLKILKDIKERNNVHLLMGNHELLLLDALFPLYEGKATLDEVMDTDEADWFDDCDEVPFDTVNKPMYDFLKNNKLLDK